MAKKRSLLAPAIRNKFFKLALIAGALFLSSNAFDSKAAEKTNADTAITNLVPDENNKQVSNINKTENVRESIFGGNRPLDTSHFTWGADLGASVDLTAHDMSTFDLDFIVGYKNKFLKTIGIGAGIHRTVQGGDNFIPIYALIRTGFSSRPTLFFLNVRFGYSFNTVEDSPMFGDYNSAIGCGINLSQTSKAKTYIILGVANRYFNKRHQDYISRLDTPSIWIAQLQFGVNF
ncbi:MAG: hypothetical protein K2H96_11585 [Muribaculaceae bacterium]|nr:hypothetical protein [Muribaculaceae bacterium]